MKVKSESEAAQSCLTLSNPMDCSPPGSSVHGIFQARVLEWGATVASKCLSESKSGMSLTLKQTLNTIKLSEEGLSKANTGPKLGLFCQMVNQVVKVKEKFSNEIKSALPVNTW